jgi:hypothetical protein
MLYESKDNRRELRARANANLAEAKSRLVTKLINGADAVSAAAYWPLILTTLTGMLAAYFGCSFARFVYIGSALLLYPTALTLLALRRPGPALLVAAWAVAIAILERRILDAAAFQAMNAWTIVLFGLIAPIIGWVRYFREEEQPASPSEKVDSSKAAVTTSDSLHIVGIGLTDMPQPYAGAIVMLETIAEFGMQSHYPDGRPTENHELCLRLARELRAAGSKTQQCTGSQHS